MPKFHSPGCRYPPSLLGPPTSPLERDIMQPCPKAAGTADSKAAEASRYGVIVPVTFPPGRLGYEPCFSLLCPAATPQYAEQVRDFQLIECEYALFFNMAAQLSPRGPLLIAVHPG